MCGRTRRLPLRLAAASALCLAVAAATPVLLIAPPGPAAAAASARLASAQHPAPAGQRDAARERAVTARSFELDRALFGLGRSGLELFGPPGAGAVRAGASAVLVADAAPHRHARKIAPLRRLLPADLLVVAPTTLPARTAARIRRLPGVLAAQLLDAARIEVNRKFTAVLGVDPSAFRAFAARPTAQSAGLWQSVADGGIAVSYTMGRQDRLPLGGAVTVAGARTEKLRVGGFGTVGIGGVDAVVSDPVARSLGIPAGNAVVISAPHADLSSLMSKISALLPAHAAVAALVTQAVSTGRPVTSGAAGAPGVTTADGPGLSAAELTRFLAAAESRVGLPYVWGAAGPDAFDCSGLVQWSLAQAGVVMPRVAADQARTGPLLPASQVQPGDLLFYHTDPTAPAYISHVAIYLGGGKMLQAPEPGMDVQIVPAILGGPGFAGAVQVYPRLAAAVAADLAG